MPLPPRPAPPNRSCTATFFGSNLGSLWANVMWLFLTGEGEIDHATLIALANGLYGQYHDHLLPQMSVNATLNGVKVTHWFDGEGNDANSTSVTTQGSIGGISLPANVACCISWPVRQHYRGGHARTYLGGIPVSAIANGVYFTGTYVSAVAAGAVAFHNGVETLTPGTGITTVEHGIMSFVKDKAWRTPPVFRRIEGDAHVDGRVDTQRRRLGPDVP